MKKILTALIIALAICLAVLPGAFADCEEEFEVRSSEFEVSEEEAGDRCSVIGAREEAVPEAEVSAEISAAEEELQGVSGEEFEVRSEEAGDRCSVIGDREEAVPEAEVPAEISAAEEELQDASEEEFEVRSSEFEENREERIEKSEESVSSEQRAESSEDTGDRCSVPGDREETAPVVNAEFTAADGSTVSLELGSAVELHDFIASLGYEGEIESFVSSNPEAIDVDENGNLIFKSAFGDETVTVVINGEEIVIPVHDPANIRAGGNDYSDKTIEEAFKYQDTFVDIVITLTGDCEVDNGTLRVEYGKKVTLDLNGYVLSGKSITTGSVITVYGNLTVTDSRPDIMHRGYVDADGLWHYDDSHEPGEGEKEEYISGGIITGGERTDLESDNSVGGAVYVTGRHATFTMTGGTIAGNSAIEGGGVFADDRATCVLNGGEISGNTAWHNGGGVYIKSDAKFTMTEGKVKDNRILMPSSGKGNGGNFYVDGTLNVSGGEISGGYALRQGGGVYLYQNSTFEMTGGSISGNEAKELGGGIYAERPAKFTMTGGSISGNSALGGGGVFAECNNGTIILGGTAQITGNTAEGKKSNLVLPSMFTIDTIVPPQSGMKIGVSTGTVLDEGEKAVISTGNDTDYSRYFESDMDGRFVVYEEEQLKIAAAGSDDVAYIVETKQTYTSVAAAVAAAVTVAEDGQTVKMIRNSVEKATVEVTGKTVVLDLNGYVLSGTGSGSVITVNGELTVTDSSPYAEHEGYVDADGLWHYDVNGTHVLDTDEVDMTISGGIITGGNADLGGGVFVLTGAKFTLDSGTIAGNKAAHLGGGVYVGAGEFTMTGGNIEYNKAGGSGGGVYLYENGKFTMTGGTLSHNGAFHGGGVFVSKEAAFTMNSGTISGCNAEKGGGVFIDKEDGKAGTFNLKGGELSGNSGGDGGAVYNKGTFTMSGGEITGNMGFTGGGVYNIGSFTMSGGTISSNGAMYGGGVHIYDYGTFTMTGGEISGNEAFQVSEFEETYVDEIARQKHAFPNGTINQELPGADPASGGWGGGVLVESIKGDAVFTMTGGSISGNKAATGAGVYDLGTITVGGTAKIAGNTADGSASNLYLTDGKRLGISTVSGMEIHVSTVRDPQSCKEVLITDVGITGKFAQYFTADDPEYLPFDYFYGGVILRSTVGMAAINVDTKEMYETVQAAVDDTSAGSTISIKMLNDSEENVTIANGKDITLDLNGHALSAKDAGSVINVYGTLTLTDSSEGKTGVITGGNADRGGGVYVNDGGSFIMNSGCISGNRAGNDGGGVYVNEGGSFTMNGGTISSNTAKANGGGVLVKGQNDYGRFTMNGGTISGNTGIDGAGVCVIYDRAIFEMTGGTISGNTASENGGGVRVYKGSFTMNGGEISSNTAVNGGGVHFSDGAAFTMTAGIIEKNTAALGGGVYDNGNMTVGGTAVINNNTLTGSTDQNNLYLPSGKTVDVRNSAEGMNISVTTEKTPVKGSPVQVTSYTEEQYADFSSDSNKYDAVKKDGYVVLAVSETVARNESTETEYTTVQEAIDQAAEGDTIKLLTDVREHVIVAEGKKITLDLNDCVFESTGSADSAVIINRGELTITDNGSSKTGHKGYVDANGLWHYDVNGTHELVDGEEELTVKGGIITGGTKHGGVYNDGKLTLSGGSITGNSAGASFGGGVLNWKTFTMIDGTISYNTAGSYGGGVYVNGGTFTMSGGSISGNRAATGAGLYITGSNARADITGGTISGNTATGNGGGIYVDGNGDGLHMFGGSITGNSAKIGGGIYINLASFLNGGEITGNTASEKAGGVYVNGSDSFVCGTVKITDNTAGGKASNLYLVPDSFGIGVYMHDVTPAEGMSVGVTLETGTGIVTENQYGKSLTGQYAKYFFSDNDEYMIVRTRKDALNDYVELVPVGDYTALNATTGTAYRTLGEAIEKAGNNTAKIVLLKDTAEPVLTIDRGQSITLDLKGHVLKGTGDGYGGGSSVINVYGSLTLMDSEPDTAHEGYVDADGLWHLGTDEGTAATINGGIITGGTENAAINVNNSGKFTMNGGTIAGNTASAAGAVYNAGAFTMNGGSIAWNTSSSFGGAAVNVGTFIMTGGNITGNRAGNDGGAVYLMADSLFMMTGGEISGNRAERFAGGVYDDGFVILGGDAKIAGNTANGKANNLYLPDGVTVSISTETAPEGMSIGVTTETAPAKGSPVKVTGENGTGEYCKYFNADSNLYEAKSLDGYVQLAVADDETIVAENVTTGTQYSSVNVAFFYANDGDEVRMLADSNEDVDIVSYKTFTLDLNGWVLTGAGGKSVITVYGNLTLKDSKGGGKVTGGNAEKGGGVYVGNEGSLTMTGGTITGNRADFGGGAFVEQDGSMTVSNAVVIDGNTLTDGTTASNLYLPEGKTVAVSNPAEGMRIGVTTEAVPTADSHVTVAEGEYAHYFKSDSADYAAVNEDGFVKLIPSSGYAARVAETGYVYETVQAAFNDVIGIGAGNYTIQLLKDVQENLNVTNSGAMTLTLDLNGHVLSADLTDEKLHSVITVGDATLTVTDSKPETVHEGKYASLPAGGVITGGNASNGGGVNVSGDSGKFTLAGGTITGNEAGGDGGGVYVSGAGAVFTMTGGTITGNEAKDGGGLYAGGHCYLLGGTIEENKAMMGGTGGGVYVDYDGVIVGGSIIINNNTLGLSTTQNNVYLPVDKTLGISTDEDKQPNGMEISVTTEASPRVQVTYETTAGKYANCFTADNPNYAAVDYTNAEGKFEVVLINTATETVAINVNTGAEYGSVNLAVSEAGDGELIRMVKDSTENVTVASGKNVTLDLNGHVLKAKDAGSVITVNGTLTLIDSDPDAVHTGDYASLPAGGVVTGGTGTVVSGKTYGGGVYVDGYGYNPVFNLQGGTITGNTADYGGGVCVRKVGDEASAEFNMTGGTITGNTANFGGGIDVANGAVFTMTDGEISRNNASNDGAGLYVNSATATVSGGEISGNTAANLGGGVYVVSGSTFTMTGGEVTGNSAGTNGGGVYDNGTLTVGGTAVINNNTLSDGTTANNLYLPEGKTLGISTDKAPDGMIIGVTTQTAPETGNTVPVTSEEGTGAYAECFTSDSSDYEVMAKKDKVVLIKKGNYVAINVETEEMYETLAEAISAAGTGHTIKLLQDVTVANFNIGKDSDIVLDLNGHTINTTDTTSTVAEGGKLTIDDSSSEKNGAIINISSGEGRVVEVLGTLTLKAGTLTGNTENRKAGWKGAGVSVYAQGTFNMEGGAITGCKSASDGGGVYNLGTFNMTGGIVSGCIAKYNNWSGLGLGEGGGVYNAGVFNFTGGEISGNKAEANGAGVYNAGTMTVGGTAVINNNTVTGDDMHNDLYLPTGKTVTVNNPEKGMEISVTTQTEPVEGSPVVIAEGEFAQYFTADNPDYEAIDKDGVVVLNIPVFVAENINTETKYTTVQEALEAAKTGETVQLLMNVQEDVTFTDEGSGRTVTLDLNGKTLSGTGEGSVITIEKGKLKITDEPGNNGAVTGGIGPKGGGVYVGSGAAFELAGGKITDNKNAIFGGGVFVDEGGTMTMSGGEISGNDAVTGGAVHNAGTFNMTGGTISGNKASYGGAVYVDGSKATFTMSDKAVISGNDANFGGGVYVGENGGAGTFNMNGGSISGNTAARGGGVHVERSDFNMSGGEISGNNAESGAGVYVNGLGESGTMTMTGGEISGNTAMENGGGIENDEGTVTMSGGTISGNSAGAGGGVHVTDGSFEMTNGTISGNEAVVGGGVAVEGGELEMTGGNITGNKAGQAGGGILNDGTVTMTGGEISGNDAFIGGGVNNEGTMTVGGDAKITGNTTDGSASNLYLQIGTTVAISTDAAPSGMSIGVTTADVPTETKRVDITGSNSADYSKNFTSDSDSFEIVNGEGNKLQMRHKNEPKPVPGFGYGRLRVYVDGELLTEGEDYSWIGGRVVLSGKFVSTLENGEHLLTIEFENGTVEETFEVSDGSVIPMENSKYLEEIKIKKAL